LFCAVLSESAGVEDGPYHFYADSAAAAVLLCNNGAQTGATNLRRDCEAIKQDCR
jgi:hypothetical protein